MCPSTCAVSKIFIFFPDNINCIQFIRLKFKNNKLLKKRVESLSLKVSLFNKKLKTSNFNGWGASEDFLKIKVFRKNG